MADRADTVLNKFKRALSQTIRSLAQNNELEISFGADRASMNGNRIRLPLPQQDLSEKARHVVRGQADSLALHIAHHNSTINARHQPKDEKSAMLFDALERARYESLGAQQMAGLAANLAAMHTERIKQIPDDHTHALSEVLGFMVREKICALPPPKAAQPLMQIWTQRVEKAAGENFNKLATLINDQDAFARLSKKIIAALATGGFEASAGGAADENNDPSDAYDEAAQNNDDDGVSGTPDEATPTPSDETASDAAGEDGISLTAADIGEAGDTPSHGTPPPPHLSDRPNWLDYKIYTSRFDEIIAAEDLCAEEELTRLRAYLDHQLQHLHGIVTRLANRLQRKLQAQQNRAWDFDLEEGYLDAARLSRVVVDPTRPLSFKMERDTDFRDTIVTLLIDNSGSMRGRPITVAAMSADILTRTLERCGVKTEVLGFTTRAWKGGKARENWVHNNKPPHPGRLNDLRHIIYKRADAPWRQARRNLGLMMREGLLKENIDGEALIWACQRLMGRPEQRRILMVISDGAPVDDSTLSVNHGNYLEKHLRQVIDEIENRTPIELIAIGIGHDVTRYYRRAVTLIDAEQLGGAITDKLAELFDEHAANGRTMPRGSLLRPQRPQRTGARV